MQEAFEILGQIQSTYGVYYVYGNHDQNNYTSMPNYTKEQLDPAQKWIVLDHQPAEYRQAAEAGCDLILSGHTHAGQIWSAGLFAALFHFDELNYGEKDVENLHAIVTSGIAGWGYPIRTERHSEYVVIQLLHGS